MSVILAKVSQKYALQKAVERQLYRETNRREVLQLYRELLKGVARSIPRKLEREAKLAVSGSFVKLAPLIYRSSSTFFVRPCMKMIWIRLMRRSS
jgi:hypothetical protein